VVPIDDRSNNRNSAKRVRMVKCSNVRSVCVKKGNKHGCPRATSTRASQLWATCVCNTTMSAKDEHVATAGAGEGEDDLEDNTPPESSEEKRVTVDSYTVRRLSRFAHTPSLLFSSCAERGRCSALTPSALRERARRSCCKMTCGAH